jgi:anthranilate phosphoribosyltransferase
MAQVFQKMASLSGFTRADCLEYLSQLQQSTPSEIGAVLGYLLGRLCGDDAAALVGALRVQHPLRRVPAPPGKLTVNLVGTGGGPSTFNITTTASFVVAAAGLVVVKSGSSAWRSQSGFADVATHLKTLKTPLSWDAVDQIAGEAGIVHLPPYYQAPSLTRVALAVGLPAYRNVAVYINLLGPLLSPVQVDHQFIGARGLDCLNMLADACLALGDPPTTLCMATDGLDEVSTSVPTALCHLASDGKRRDEIIDPRLLAIEPPAADELRGYAPPQAAACCERILQGAGSTAQTQIVAINAAAVMTAAGVAPDLPAAYQSALNLIASGAALDRLHHLRRCVAHA